MSKRDEILKKRMNRAFILLVILFCFRIAAAQEKSVVPTTSGMEKMPGFISMFWDAKKGKIWFELDKLDTEILYYPSLASGIGSNDIGLDRGRISEGKVVKFQRAGNKVLLIEPNYAYRAITDNVLEKQAVEESFAQSVLWGFEISSEENGKLLMDATGFFMQDAVNAVLAISRTKQGNYKLDPSRCAIYLPRTKNFPKNTEVEVTITLTGEQPGAYLREVVPSPNAVSMRQHHSFVELPDNNYKPRVFDPRSGVGSISYFDYATPVSEPIEKRFMRRHRLEIKDPSAAMSEAVKPIIYYVDPGTPEPIRSALVEGTSWWNTAFEAAGFKNAFQVKLLPADADPMDVRYNLVQWVHRSTRGWSYGGGITDPRTGEIIKGKVTLGSLRVRQDFLIAQGLVADFEDGKPLPPAIMELCMQRMRQLAAHEVGHTLGLPHNYISNISNRSSVMDYPYPMIKMGKDNKLDLSNAYTKEIGEWDKVAITLAYKPFTKGVDEKKELDKMVKSYIGKGLRFLTDQDARPPGSSSPYTHLWDNGANAVEELKRVMEIRSVVLNNFSEKKIAMGEPMATLEEVLVPAYMMHRYQIEAASKVLGGVDYTYALRGDGQKPNIVVSATEQWKALDALLTTLKPANLALSAKLLDLIPPRPFGYDGNPRELFKGNTGITFDPLGPASAVSEMTLYFTLYPERAARIVSQHALDAELPGLDAVVDKIMDATWKSSEETGYHGEIQRVVNTAVLQHLLKLSVEKSTSAQVRAIAGFKVNELKGWLSQNVDTAKSIDQKAHYQYALTTIKNFEQNPVIESLPAAAAAPDGAPIGSSVMNWLDLTHCNN